MLSLSLACPCQPGHRAREGPLGFLSCRVAFGGAGGGRWRFQPLLLSLSPCGLFRRCKGREKCRKPNGMLLRHRSLLQPGEGDGLGRRPSWGFLCLVLFGNLSSVWGRGGGKRKGGSLRKATVSSLLRGYPGVQQKQSTQSRARLPCSLHSAEHQQQKNQESAELYSLTL